MNRAIEFLKIHKILLLLLTTSLVFLLSSIAVLVFSYHAIPTSIVTRFEQLGEVVTFGARSELWGICLLGFFISLVNGFLVYEFWQRERVLSYIIAGANTVFSILIFVVVTVLISNN